MMMISRSRSIGLEIVLIMIALMMDLMILPLLLLRRLVMKTPEAGDEKTK